MQSLAGQVGTVGRVSSKVPDLETLIALQAWGDLQQLQEFHVVEQRPTWTYTTGLPQLPDASKLTGDPLPVLVEATLRGLRAQCQHLQSYMESNFEM